MSATFGLDVGRAAVKMVRVEAARGEPRAVRGAFRDVDPTLEGDRRRGAVSRAIAECAAELGAKPGSAVAVAVPRAEAVVKRATLPDVPAEELASLIRFQAAKDVPFEIEEVVLAHGRLGATPAGGLEVLYAAVRSAVVEELRRTVVDAGFRPGVLEVSTQAAARLARLIEPERQDALLILIGARASDIVLLERGRVTLSRSASVGYLSAGEGDLAWVERLAQEVTRSLRAAREGEAPAPKELLLAGGGATRPEVVRTLSSHLGLPAHIVNGLAPGVGASEQGAPYVVARGLADPRAVEGVPSLDLAGIAERDRATRTRQLLVGAVTVAVALLLGGVLFARSEVQKRERQANALERERERLKPEEKKVKAIAQEVQVADRWFGKKTRALDLLLAVSRSLPKDDAYLTRFQWTEGKTLVLIGRARDQNSVTKFLRNLEKTDEIERATPESLITPTKAAEAEAKGVEFSVNVKLKGETPEVKK